MNHPVFKRKNYKGEAKRIFKKESGIAILCGVVLGFLFYNCSGFSFEFVDMFDYLYFAEGIKTGISVVVNGTKSMLVVNSMFSFLPFDSILIWLITILYFFFLFLPVTLSLQNVFKDMAKYGVGDVDFLYVFKSSRRYLHTLAIAFVSRLFIMIGCVLFLFPGLYLSLRYYYVDIIAIEEPDLSIYETLKKSALLTKHVKFDLFVLPLSFSGWITLAFIISTFTFGFGFMMLLPYIYMTIAYSYFDIIEQLLEDSNEY